MSILKRLLSILLPIGCLILTCCLALSCSNLSSRLNSGSMDWKLFRGNPALSGYTDTRLPDEPVLLWTYKGEDRTVSSPVVASGTTYWSDRRGHIRGVNLKGELVFEYDLQTAVEATPMISDSTLYIGRIDGFMTALSLSRKDTVWSYETMGQISASPNVMEFEGKEAIVFGSYDNYLYWVDAGGKELSRFESGYYLNGATALCEGYAVFGGCDSYVRVIDCRTGIQTDSLELDAYIPASPAIVDNYCYVGDYSGNIYELILEKGKITHHSKIISASDDNGSFVSVPAVSDKTLYAYSGERSLRAVNRKNGAQNWEYLLKGGVGESSPVVCNDKVIACTKTGIVSIFDADSGKLLWEYDMGEEIKGSPAVIKNHFMVLTTKGTLFCFGASA